MARAAKKRPGLSVLIAVGGFGLLYLGGVVAEKVSKKQTGEEAGIDQPPHEVVDVARDLNSAIQKWLEAATQENLTEEVVNDLTLAYAAYREAPAAVEGTSDEPEKWEREFYARSRA